MLYLSLQDVMVVNIYNNNSTIRLSKCLKIIIKWHGLFPYFDFFTSSWGGQIFARELHIYLVSAVRRPDEQKCMTCTIGCCQWTQPVSQLHNFSKYHLYVGHTWIFINGCIIVAVHGRCSALNGRLVVLPGGTWRHSQSEWIEPLRWVKSQQCCQLCSYDLDSFGW